MATWLSRRNGRSRSKLPGVRTGIGSVHAAHAVDGHVFDEEVSLHEVLRRRGEWLGRRRRRGLDRRFSGPGGARRGRDLRIWLLHRVLPTGWLVVKPADYLSHSVPDIKAWVDCRSGCPPRPSARQTRFPDRRAAGLRSPATTNSPTRP